jgi:DNA polymerase/3'-5' exonuclease PolX
VKLDGARKVALNVVGLMRPFCERIEIAGSIRRGVADVKDIEIVCIPSWADWPKEGSLLAETEPVNVLHQAVANAAGIRWIKPGVPGIEDWPIKPDGRYWRGLVLRDSFDAPADIKLDVFLARPENWGVILTIRTGAADFSRALVTYARDRTDYRVDGGQLMLAGGPAPCPDERNVFDALQLEWVAPTERVDERSVRAKS